MRSLAQQSGLVLAVTKGRVSLIYSDLAGFPQSLASSHFRFRSSGVHSFHRQPLKDVSVESLEKHCIGMRSTGPSFASVILSLCLHQELGFEVFAYLLCLVSRHSMVSRSATLSVSLPQLGQKDNSREVGHEMMRCRCKVNTAHGVQLR